MPRTRLIRRSTSPCSTSPCASPLMATPHEDGSARIDFKKLKYISALEPTPYLPRRQRPGISGRDASSRSRFGRRTQHARSPLGRLHFHLLPPTPWNTNANLPVLQRQLQPPRCFATHHRLIPLRHQQPRHKPDTTCRKSTSSVHTCGFIFPATLPRQTSTWVGSCSCPVPTQSPPCYRSHSHGRRLWQLSPTWVAGDRHLCIYLSDLFQTTESHHQFFLLWWTFTFSSPLFPSVPTTTTAHAFPLREGHRDYWCLSSCLSSLAPLVVSHSPFFVTSDPPQPLPCIRRQS